MLGEQVERSGGDEGRVPQSDSDREGRCLTEVEAKRLSWSALQLAAVPSGPWFIPAVVAIARFLLDADAARFDLVDIARKQTLVHHVEPHGWTSPVADSLSLASWASSSDAASSDVDARQLTVRLPSRVGFSRAVTVWRTRADFGATDHLLLECLRPHLIVAWNRCADVGNQLVEIDWSDIPVIRLGIDARGAIDVGANPHRSEVLTAWLNGSGRTRSVEDDLHIADDGSFSILGHGLEDGTAPEVHGWLLSRPLGSGSDMFLWSSTCLAARGQQEATSAQRPTFAQIDRVAQVWRLTPKQRLVIEELASGQTNKDIAEALSCAEVTVEYHLTAIRKKIGGVSRAALISRFWIDAHGARGR